RSRIVVSVSPACLARRGEREMAEVGRTKPVCRRLCSRERRLRTLNRCNARFNSDRPRNACLPFAKFEPSSQTRIYRAECAHGSGKCVELSTPEWRLRPLAHRASAHERTDAYKFLGDPFNTGGPIGDDIFTYQIAALQYVAVVSGSPSGSGSTGCVDG